MTKDQAQRLVESDAWKALEADIAFNIQGHINAGRSSARIGQSLDATRHAEAASALENLVLAVYETAGKERVMGVEAVFGRPRPREDAPHEE